ncbi:MAG: sulfotransferase family protein [Parvibaculales bacterium]
MSDTVFWTPPPRPDWLQAFNDEGAGMDIKALVPLEAEELIIQAKSETGFDDFGDDDWRQPFEVLIKSLDEEAELNFFGRLMTRSDILIWLKALLGIQAAFNEHPEIADEKIEKPVFMTGLARSGTSILFELLAQDPKFGSPRHWEMMFPYPAPETATYETDPRIAKAQHLVTLMNRVTPTVKTMHELDASLPNECVIGQSASFISENIAFLFQVPSYINYIYTQGNWEYSYSLYKKMLQVLQFRNPRDHWLLKAPSHLNFLPVLFKVFPDAEVLITHRDPIYAQASVTNLAGTFFYMRSDKKLDVKAFEGLLSPEAMSQNLNRIIDWLEGGDIPKHQVSHSLYADLISKPDEALAKIYDQLGFEFTEEAKGRMEAYLAAKPKAKFGKHSYSIGEQEEIDRKRAFFARYQDYFNVPVEEKKELD